MPQERGEALRGNVARGGELFRLNCAACHNFTGRGGALTSGKFAPSLDPANEEQIYTAMLTGPSNMPVFGDRQLSPEEKRDIIAYVESVQQERNNYGGHPLGSLGPVSEGAVAWVIGIAALVLLTLWIGARA
jgi:ubiquinol-cytochrome c reductase cytochrome c subunit